MWLTSWLRDRIAPPHPRSRHCRQIRFRPCIEVLEGRCLPSTLTVTSTADSGPGSLRAEIAAAQSGDTIVFDPSIAGTMIQLTSGELVINKSLDIEWQGAGPLTVSGHNRRGRRRRRRYSDAAVSCHAPAACRPRTHRPKDAPRPH